jgi:outer membrane protein OmpA-like peptidoglycan-associated protein
MQLIGMFPNAVIEIGSHTDSTGTDDYNIRLSQRRSESVVKYLIDKGIPETRLLAKGYGESMPIDPNSNPDGSDNPAGRQLNRRTELKIIGESNLFYEDE